MSDQNKIRNAVENARQWKAVAIGLGAHLELVERHCSIQTGKVGQAHADEGKELREAGRKAIALVYDQLARDPNNPVLPSASVQSTHEEGES